MTSADDVLDRAEMVNEMLTVGTGMFALVTAVLLEMVLVSNRLEQNDILTKKN